MEKFRHFSNGPTRSFVVETVKLKRVAVLQFRLNDRAYRWHCADDTGLFCNQCANKRNMKIENEDFVKAFKRYLRVGNSTPRRLSLLSTSVACGVMQSCRRPTKSIRSFTVN